jgi:hypothetical protein
MERSSPTFRLDFLHARQAVETLLFHEEPELDVADDDDGLASSRCEPLWLEAGEGPGTTCR